MTVLAAHAFNIDREFLSMLPASVNINVNKESPVPLRDQLVEQIGLQIAAGVLKNNEKLPSIRALAQKLGIHHGVVNAAYNHLAEIGMLEIRQGSGVRVVPKLGADRNNEKPDLNALFMQFVSKASELGFSRGEIKSCTERLLQRPAVKQILFVDRNPDFHPIILAALAPHFSIPVVCITADDLRKKTTLLADSLVITSLYHFLSLQGLPIDPTRFMILNVKPAQEVASKIKELPEGSIVLLVSASPTLLRIASNIAAGLRGETIAIRTVLTEETKEMAYMMRYAKIVVCDRPSEDKVRGLAKQVPVFILDLYTPDVIQSIKDRLKEWG
jgi:DNA-binding transcriptional regulator YhcF (GntR family)